LARQQVESFGVNRQIPKALGFEGCGDRHVLARRCFAPPELAVEPRKPAALFNPRLDRDQPLAWKAKDRVNSGTVGR
jgi:hypothetical protein